MIYRRVMRTPFSRKLTAPLAGVLLVLAGCGGQDDAPAEASGPCAVGAIADLKARATARGTSWVSIGAEPLPELRGPGWRVAALWPIETSGSCDENDRSIVVAAEFAGRRLVLAGDIESGAEWALAARTTHAIDAASPPNRSRNRGESRMRRTTPKSVSPARTWSTKFTTW